MSLFQGYYQIGNLQAISEFIGPKEPLGQALSRRTAEVEASTLALLFLTLRRMEAASECSRADVDGVMESFGVDSKGWE